MTTVHIRGTDIPVTAYKGLRVLTTERLAKVFGTVENNIAKNLANNLSRFDDGKHFFRIEGEELRDMKNRPDFIQSVGKNARSLLLWTDRGAARHAKILDTDMAWSVYGELEEAYFDKRDNGRPLTMAEMALQNAQALVDIERRQDEQNAALVAVRSDVAIIKQAHTVLEKMPTDCEGIERIRTRLNKQYGLSIPVVDKIMRDSPYAPTIRVLVRNPHADGVHNSGFAVKEVSAIFKRFVGESQHSAGRLYTHPYIEGRFQIRKPEPETKTATE